MSETTTGSYAMPLPHVLESSEDLTFQDVVPGKHAIAVLGQNGDTKHIWDKGNEVEVEAARQLFLTLRSKGYLAFRVAGKDGAKGTQMKDFDPSAERVILVPPMQGG